MYIIIEWNMDISNAWIMLDQDNDDNSGNIVFDTEKEAKDYADLNCAFQYQIIKIKGGE